MNRKGILVIFSILISSFLVLGSVCACENISESFSQEPLNNTNDTDYEVEMNNTGLNENNTDNNNFTDEEVPSYDNGMNETNALENNSSCNYTENYSIPDAPKIIKLQYYPKNDDYYAKFTWVSKIGSTYEILRKDTDEFNAIATVYADSEEMAFYDNIGNDCSYTYSVREIIDDNDSEIIYGLYDVEGLRLIASPSVSVDFQNLMANVTWSKIDNVTKYRIFRKLGRDGQFKCIAVLDANQSNYVDYYYNSAKELSSILNSKTFADPSFNNLFYTVRACEIKANSTNYGLYLKDGDFNLESPSIVCLNNNTIKWGYVPNADGYSVLKKNGTDWEVIGQVDQKNKAVISMPMHDLDYNAYYSVQAYAIKNGEIAYSDFDKGFSLMNYTEDNSNFKILYFGDSITYGSPYKAASSRHIFSIPHRVAQLLGNVYYNPSIPGSTYHDLGQIDGKNILNSKYYRYRICRELVDPIFLGQLPGNWEDLDTAENSEGITNTTIDYYNIVVLSAGTNDYLDNSELGSEDSNDTITFNGAFNHIMNRIENASKMRVDRGESPLKVVFVDLYYSDRSYNIKIRQNRDVVPNKIGLTLCDYQDALDKQYSKWQNSEYLKLYNFNTRDYNIVNEDTCPYLASDNLHYTKYAYGQYGNAFAKYLLEEVFKDNSSCNYTENYSIPDAPKIIKLQYYPKNDDYYAKFTWVSKIGSTYEILRKDTDEFNAIATVYADSEEMAFYDNIGNDCSYTYSVREIIDDNDSEIIYGLYDVEGLRLIASPSVSVDFQNLMANVTWSKIDNVTKYRIFRKLGRDGQFKCIAVLDANQSNYVDYYYNSAKELSSILNSKTFADPSFNNLFYTVRACEIKANSTNYGLYLKDGDFNLESPSIVCLNNNTIKWGYVPNADGYSVLKKNGTDWEVIGQVDQKNKAVISMPMHDLDYNAYYSVQAYAIKNGEIAYSDFDKGFSLMNYTEDNSNFKILYFGDSITYGSPYKAASSRHIFSIPHRVAQLLGNVYYNPSIPGSTYHDLGQIDGKNILNSKYYRYRICRELVDPIFLGQLPGNWEDLDTAENSEGITNTTIDYYNIVVLSAGTNDYLDNSELGSEDSNDTITFNGAFNHIMNRIENASKMRVDRGESPLKVVFVDLYYSDRSYNIKIRQNRDVVPNKIGLTLCDYQDALDKQYSKWQNSEYLKLYNFNTRDYNIVNEDTCPYLASDNLHYTKYAYGQYGNAFAKYLLEEVFKDNSSLMASDVEMTYGDGSFWNVTLSNQRGNAISGAYVNIGVLGNVYRCLTDDNGTAAFPINLAPGTYQINATFEGNSFYESSFINNTITVGMGTPVLSAESLSMFYRDGSCWNVTLSGENGDGVSGVYVKIGVLGKVYRCLTDDNGTASLPINLAPGTYQINATFDGDYRFHSAFINATLTVNKAILTLTGEDLVMSYRDGSSWNVTLSNQGGNAISGVYVKIGVLGKVYRCLTNDNGTASLPINLAPGTYQINATFDGDYRFHSAFINATLTVNKAILTLTGEDLVMGYGDGSSYKIYLTDFKGNPVANVDVKFIIGQSCYTVKTDSNGTASLAINLYLGNYTIQASISDSKYELVNITNSITVNTDNLNITASDVNMTYKDGTSYEIRLVDTEGRPIQLSGQIIKVTIKNKTYGIKTNAMGIAKLAINLSAGNYSITSRYNNNVIVNNITVNSQ